MRLRSLSQKRTGDVSITLDNQLMHGLSQEEYLTILRKNLIVEEKQNKIRSKPSWT